MYEDKKKISIFVDTNVLQSFYGDRNVCLYKINVPEEYYKLIDFIIHNKLQDYIEICIPDIVMMEYKQHMMNCFVEKKEQLNKDKAIYEKIFGSLIEIHAEVKISSVQYQEFIDELFKGFIDNPRNFCKVVSYKNCDGLIDILLKKALSGVKPFAVGKMGGKDYSDAGFKDAIIAETIYNYCKEKSRVGIFISKDKDFSNIFHKTLNNENDYVLFNTFDFAIQELKNYYGIEPIMQIKSRIQNNTYYHEMLLSEVEVDYDKMATSCTIQNIVQETGNIYNIDIDIIVNETKYHFNTKFDDNANEFIDITYSMEND